MAVCWEAVLGGRQGRKVSRARPGKGAGQVEVEGPWKLEKQLGR